MIELPLSNTEAEQKSKPLLKHGIGFLLPVMKHTGPVALAGETAGGVWVRLDFFVSFCIKAKRKMKIKEPEQFIDYD
jgi:hypothetical protein